MSVSSHFPRFFLLFSRSSSPPLLQPSAPGLSAIVQRHFALSSSRPIFASVHTRNNVRKRPVHLWSFYSHSLSDIFSDILSGTSPNMLTFFVTYLLDILSGIYSESLSGIPPSILSDTLSDIPSDILSDWLSFWPTSWHSFWFLTYLLTFLLTFFLTHPLTFFLTVFLAYLPTFCFTLFLTYRWHSFCRSF